MEKQKVSEIPNDSLTYLFNKDPFVLCSPDIKLTHEIIYKIYKDSNSFKESLNNFSISEKNYNITFEEEEENCVKINFDQDGKKIESQYEILKTPYKINFENIEEMRDKTMYIFKKVAYKKLIIFLDSKTDKYEYIEDINAKTLLVKNKLLKIKEEIFKVIAEKNSIINVLEDFKVKTIDINPLSLSSNFFSIFKEVPQDKTFTFILNEERIEFFKRLIDFHASEKLFYYITGSDGIGKSLSLLYYSSLSKKRFLYFNIKLYFREENDEKFRNLFYNDLHKFFLINYPERDKDFINSEYNLFIERIEEYLRSEISDDMKNIGKIFKYIIGFMNSLAGDDYTIILNQYKSDVSDINYVGLNSIIKFILNNKKTLRIKLIISSSVDNTSNKYILLRNLSQIYLDVNPSNFSKLLFEEPLDNINLYNNENIISRTRQNTEINDELNNKKDCEFCEKIFKIEREKRKQALKNENNDNYYLSESKCLIDKYPDYTIKDYYFSLTNAKKICNNILSKDELIMAEIFNFSLKYIIKYLHLKREMKEKDKGTNEKKIIRMFYDKISGKMKLKINNFYEDLYNKNYKDNKDNNYSNYIHMEFQSLCKLRNFIFYEKKFIMSDLAQQLLIFPMKYLQIAINDYKDSFFPLKEMGLNFSFKLEYNNNFTRILINRIIDDLFKNITKVSINSFKGSAEGTFLELKIDELFRNNSSQIFDLINLECRYLFSLVSKTDNSDLTIKKHREEELKLLFIGKDSYSSILIDDINDDKKNSQQIIIN